MKGIGRAVPPVRPRPSAQDVLEWTRQLGSEPVHLVRHDWGAVVTQFAAALAPEPFRTLTTIAVPPLQAWQDGLRKHPVQLRNSW